MFKNIFLISILLISIFCNLGICLKSPFKLSTDESVDIICKYLTRVKKGQYVICQEIEDRIISFYEDSSITGENKTKIENVLDECSIDYIKK